MARGRFFYGSFRFDSGGFAPDPTDLQFAELRRETARHIARKMEEAMANARSARSEPKEEAGGVREGVVMKTARIVKSELTLLLLSDAYQAVSEMPMVAVAAAQARDARGRPDEAKAVAKLRRRIESADGV